MRPLELLDWSHLNALHPIPQTVLKSIRRFSAGTTVLDFGCGPSSDVFVDYHAKRCLRYDVDGFLEADDQKKYKDWKNFLNYQRRDVALTVVFSRVLSLLSSNELQDIKQGLMSVQSADLRVVVYDYVYNPRDVQKYGKCILTPIGRAHERKPSWSNRNFYHHCDQNFSELLDGSIALNQFVAVPGVRDVDCPGVLKVIQRNGKNVKVR